MNKLKQILLVLLLGCLLAGIADIVLAQGKKPQNLKSSLTTFRNERYKFQIKHPDNCLFAEFPGELSDSYITRFWIRCDYGETDIQVFKKESDLTSSETLRLQVIRWMGWSSWPEEQMTTYKIGSRPAVRQDYLYGTEQPGAPPLAVNVWTFNDAYSFSIGCCCGKKECNSSISTFSFTE